VVPLAPALDHIGPMGATVADTALLAEALSLTGAGGRMGQPVTGVRIGYARDWFAQDPATHPGVLAAMDRAASDLSMAGARVMLTTLPDYARLEQAGIVLLQHQALAQHRAHLPGAYGASTRAALLAGAALTDADLALATQAADAARQAITDILSPFDALITANVLAPAPPFAAFAKGAVWTAMRTLPFNLTGHPALALPIGLVGDLPVGMQIIGRHRGCATLLQIAQAFEMATDHAVIRPPVT
jgi:aspartyl-tRNA(Asn)/glutamyl-tRNA(Gln) amidotransferase subunit A